MLQEWSICAKVSFMENTNMTEQTELIKEVNSKLSELGLSKAWAAKQIGVTSEYMRKVLSLGCELSRNVKEKLIIFLDKLKEIDKILAA